MKLTQVAAAIVASLVGSASAAISSVVTGTPMGFASSVTGGGTATPVYPTTIDELKSYLTSSSAEVIVISGTFDFAGSEGTQTEEACNAYSCTPSDGGQALLNTLDGCGSTAVYDVTIDTAAYQGIAVASDKTLVGTDGATLNGKGLVFNGVSNIIIQNIAITNLNPEYVWGGDALSFTDTNNIWIDHVTTSSLGRQHYSFGTGSNNAVTISNSFIDGSTDYSATCDGHTYWGLELVGSGDFITFYQNWVYYTSGRSPALSGNTVFHAVNNVWSSNSGHLIEGTDDGMGLYEGNYFINTPTIVADGFVGQLFSSESADLSQCDTYLGRNCVVNLLGSDTGTFDYDQYGWFSDLSGRPIVAAASASSIATSVVDNAGNTL
ncbi:family 1 polysaccharide lyase [Cryphonectria parasitica EP155]|uniref:pectin lyase n=1 Tax=Cryphonectria parasitica (strain ATCC 38755 / EP155) TaxID=660469 RepID=A0A9P4Y7E4_CRYP1|nr:family 1 polysaccharide lyase [Cryphonectria parasitica EP155]KAF3768106.1 family 1 polysaccharide lyase [Cryphonectria parasitica EP155]